MNQRKAQISSLSRVALLATGDELVEGEILNTNGQAIATQLNHHSIKVGTHVVAADNEDDICIAIQFLLASHDILIITGGLGPTSDDCTRYALSRAIDQPLIFNEASWQSIVDRLSRFSLQIHEANKQQALFPQDAEIIPNPNGTANGCCIHQRKKTIYMLPGPPKECLPMFKEVVLPALIAAKIHTGAVRSRWRLFGVSEGEIAARLDEIVKPYHCVTGYRWHFPYLDFKLLAEKAVDMDAVTPAVNAALAPYQICDADHTASELLQQQLTQMKRRITICDHATGGLLESCLTTPASHAHVKFVSQLKAADKKGLTIEINGLQELWQGLPAQGKTSLEIIFSLATKHEVITQAIPFRSQAVLQYAVEFICYQIQSRLG